MPNVPTARPAPTRRWRLSRGPLLVGAGLGAVALVVVVIGAFAWPNASDVDAPSRFIDAGDVDDFVVGEPVRNVDEKFYVLKVESGEFLALYQRDPHSGCTVPWSADFLFQARKGWFWDPCHGATYDVEGNLIFGPSPRGLDRFPVEVRDDRLVVDTSRVICGPGAPEGMVCGP